MHHALFTLGDSSGLNNPNFYDYLQFVNLNKLCEFE